MGPYIVSDICGNRVKLEKDGHILKNLVSINNVKKVVEKEIERKTEKLTNNEGEGISTQEETTIQIQIREFIQTMAKTNSLEEIVRICEEKNKSAKVPLNMASFSKSMLDCPVVSFINEVLKSSEALMDNIRDEVLKVIKIELVDDFTGTMILTCSILAKAFTEKVPVLQVLDTLSSRPSFLSPYVEPEGLKPEERLTVAGEGINQNDLDSLKGTSWLNDKVINGYARLLAREANDSTDPNGKRMFVIPSYTAVLWENGVYDRFMYRKVDLELFDYVVVPWNKNGNHWVVLVACTKDLSVTVYDSLGADNSALIAKFCHFMKIRSGKMSDGFEHWTTYNAILNKQTDNSSCGIFVLMTLESLSKGKASWILRQVHVVNFRNYVMKRLMSIGVRNTYLCDSLYCKDPKGRKIQWINCDVCSRWWHKMCCAKSNFQEEFFQCEICDAQFQ